MDRPIYKMYSLTFTGYFLHIIQTKETRMNSSGYPMANSDQVSSAQTENGKDGVSKCT